MTGHRVRRQQEGSGELLVIWALSPSCPSPGRSRFRTWIPKEQKGPGSAADLHRPLCVLLPHREQGAAEEPHGPSLHSPSTHCPSTLTTARGHIPLPAQCPSMEVTTVSPSAASPTEGDDLCETDVTTVATHSVTLLICLCGLAGNRAVVSLLSLKGMNNSAREFLRRQVQEDHDPPMYIFYFPVTQVTPQLRFLSKEQRFQTKVFLDVPDHGRRRDGMR